MSQENLTENEDQGESLPEEPEVISLDPSQVPVSHLCFYSYDEIFDLTKYPILSDKRTNESEIDLATRKDKRVRRILSRTSRIRLRYPNAIHEVGVLISVNAEVPLMDLKNALSFQDQNGQEIVLLKELNYKIGIDKYGSNIAQIFDVYRKSANENAQLLTQLAQAQAKIQELEQKAVQMKSLEQFEKLKTNADAVLETNLKPHRTITYNLSNLSKNLLLTINSNKKLRTNHESRTP
jgi:hypothetical protein